MDLGERDKGREKDREDQVRVDMGEMYEGQEIEVCSSRGWGSWDSQ